MEAQTETQLGQEIVQDAEMDVITMMKKMQEHMGQLEELKVLANELKQKEEELEKREKNLMTGQTTPEEVSIMILSSNTGEADRQKESKKITRKTVKQMPIQSTSKKALRNKNSEPPRTKNVSKSERDEGTIIDCKICRNEHHRCPICNCMAMECRRTAHKKSWERTGEPNNHTWGCDYACLDWNTSNKIPEWFCKICKTSNWYCNDCPPNTLGNKRSATICIDRSHHWVEIGPAKEHPWGRCPYYKRPRNHYKRPIHQCRYYLAGYCKNGNRCEYSHGNVIEK